jgi:SAM-dependent methyltransferase
MERTEAQTEPEPMALGWTVEDVTEVTLRLMADISPGKLLDASAGGGHLGAQLAKQGFEVAGIDIVRDLWRRPEMPFVCADLDGPLPFRNDSFDAIVHVGNLAYLESPVRVFREFSRILKPKGVLSVTIENILSLESRTRFMLNGTYRWYPHHQYHGEEEAALYMANRDPMRLTTLIFHLERAGFTIERIVFGGKPGYYLMLPMGWLFRALTTLHNAVRKGKGRQTPPIVNSDEALLYRYVGVLARRKR